MNPARIVDLSHNLDPATPVYPGDPPVEVRILDSTRYKRADGRASLNTGWISVGLHVGTHMDAPFHFIEKGQSVDQLPVEQCVGPALLLDVEAGAGGTIHAGHLAAARQKLRKTPKVVLRTGWSREWGKPEYFSRHPVITIEAARFLVECGVHLVGVDFPSVDVAPFPVHVELLRHGVAILENLTNLDRLQEEVFQLVALPLKITARDGSPVRAVALMA